MIPANASERPEPLCWPGHAGSQGLPRVVLTWAGFNSCQVVEQLVPSLSLETPVWKSNTLQQSLSNREKAYMPDVAGGRLWGSLQNLSWQLMRIKQATTKHLKPCSSRPRSRRKPDPPRTPCSLWWRAENAGDFMKTHTPLHTHTPFCFNPHNPEENWQVTCNTKNSRHLEVLFNNFKCIIKEALLHYHGRLDC